MAEAKNCEEPNTFIYDSQYFKLIEKIDSKVKSSCKLCVNNNVISGFETVTSNFVTHLKVILLYALFALYDIILFIYELI